MPFRYYHPPRSAIPRHIANPPHHVLVNNPQPCRPFHSSRHDRAPAGSSNPDDSTHDHYETLNVHPSASPAEIKKSYFHLSKLHHPDHNPSDPSSSHRFMRISEAYTILSHPANRARYDRSRATNPRYAHQHHPHAPKSGSYHSSNPAGGRPPSGLSSRRKTAFQGPPPSFYKSGGWGAHASKRRAAHESSTAQQGSPEGKTHARQDTSAKDHQGWENTTGPESNPGMGFGQDPYYKYGFGGFGYGTNTGSNPFFDPHSHQRTHRRHEERRAKRAMKRRGLSLDADDSMIGTFFVLSGCVAASVVGAMLIGGFGGGLGR
ncbi:uncharacterized protein PODANS_2_9790 [Podospora anserina S mat+]|uniref:Podospora anserina S mat+ genomic DNA chromosome 2, supercontig 2 n=1 Tax=Podospora anserina (strain S / ATCC MYA-4624 / DSM 980 / FGSC 10383) TaxID=515849 RepID=B2B737_PODAN|nr:uncharacterized protein PODANS_2_9790 [Podospora anserina S mat+]CAP73615.1 unnamed protein product [Podospora anserina S mat+]CDP26017.1 Putative protein of unknown function [Podospora anserina S mat+]